MTCFFPKIRAFSNKAEVNPLRVTCYSLQKWQKGMAITLCVLAILTTGIGALSLTTVPLLNAKVAWVLVGVGVGVASSLTLFLTIFHLKFVKKVEGFLSKEGRKMGSQGENYPLIDTGSPASVEEEGFYILQYSLLLRGLDQYHFDFNRTKAIHEERKNM